MIYHDVIVIGGGASGVIASLVASDLGVDLGIVEGEKRILRKVLITGNGRCNISNQKISYPFVNFHSNNPKFFQNILQKFTVKDTIDLFNFYGLPITTLEEGKMYPNSLQASSVVDILLMNLEERNIPIYLENKVKSIKKQDNYFIIETNNNHFKSKKVLLSCGGKAKPQTGSDGSMYEIIKKLGHKIIKPEPSIVQLKLAYDNLKAISGVRFDCLAKVIVNKEIKRQEFDEVLFTDYGISGPAVLQLSRHASLGVASNKEVKILLDLFPHLQEDELLNLLEMRFSLFSQRTIYQCLIGLIHKKLIVALLKDLQVESIHKTCYSFTHQEIIKLTKLLKNWEFNCSGTNGFDNAQTTIGGVDTKEVNSETLESKIVKGLYFSGEILDVDGDCGGFNLQWAWSSGYIAGKSLGQGS